jgi:PKD domain
MRSDEERNMRSGIASFFPSELVSPVRIWLVTLVVATLGSSCTLDNPQAPALEGPSLMGRSIVLRAVPDSIVSDGFSSSVIEAVLQGPNGERLSGATIDFDLAAQGSLLDLGNLAPLNGARPTAGGVESGPVSATTDGDGVARARYWAPFRSDQANDTTVTILARESGTNFRFALQSAAETDIFLRAADRPSFPGSNICGFTIEPTKVNYKIGELISFTATQSNGDDSIDGCAGNEIARYEWTLSDGTYKAERGIVHAFGAAGNFGVTLVTTEAITGCQSSCAATVKIVP